MGEAKADPENTSEAIAMLVDMAGRKTLPIPPLMLAEHTMALPGSWDWPVRRAAFEAILRRSASAKTQELSLLDKPANGPFGPYLVDNPQVEGSRPYHVHLYGKTGWTSWRRSSSGWTIARSSPSGACSPTTPRWPTAPARSRASATWRRCDPGWPPCCCVGCAARCWPSCRRAKIRRFRCRFAMSNARRTPSWSRPSPNWRRWRAVARSRPSSFCV